MCHIFKGSGNFVVALRGLPLFLCLQSSLLRTIMAVGLGGGREGGWGRRESYLLNWTAVQQLWSVTVSFRCSAFNPLGGSVFRLLCTMISLDTTHVEESVVSLLVETVEDKSVGLSSAPSPIDHRVCSHPDVLFSAHTVPLANVVLKWLNRLSFRATSTLGFIRRVNLMGVVSLGLRGR